MFLMCLCISMSVCDIKTRISKPAWYSKWLKPPDLPGVNSRKHDSVQNAVLLNFKQFPSESNQIRPGKPDSCDPDESIARALDCRYQDIQGQVLLNFWDSTKMVANTWSWILCCKKHSEVWEPILLEETNMHRSAGKRCGSTREKRSQHSMIQMIWSFICSQAYPAA